jgi:nitrile hydratase
MSADPGHPHNHGHGHDHGQEPPSATALRAKALESLLVEKGLVDPAALDALIHWEFPRLCRGGSRSLTFPGVCPDFLATAL